MSAREALKRSPDADPPTTKEAAVAVFATACFLLIEVWLFGGGTLFTRPLWLDEIHTVLVADRQDVLTSMKSLADGADFNPPTLFLVYRLVGSVAGGLTESTLRVVAFVSVAATLPIVYVMLRSQFSRWAAAVGALAVWAQSVVVAEAFDARFYGPWLFGAAWLSLAAQRAVEDRASWSKAALLAVASVFVCTIHYFGILSWGAAILVAVWFRRDARRQTVVRLLPAVAGPVALALCTPLYVGQRAALTTATWIPDLSIAGAIFLAGLALLTPPLLVAVIGWGASHLLRRTSVNAGTPLGTRPFALGPALLLGQALVPIALAVFSLTVQPALQPRYSIAATLFTASIVALAFERSMPLFRVISVVAIVASSATIVAEAGRNARDRVRVVHEDVDQVSRIAGRDSLVVARRRHSIYPIVLARPTLASHIALFDGASVLPNDKFEIVERDVARVHLRHYGFPRIVTRLDLESTPAFYFLEADSTRSPRAAEFPGYQIQRVGTRMFRVAKP